MKALQTLKKIGASVNQKATAAVVATTAFIATNSYAGAMADAVKTETADVKTDLYAVGAIVIGFAVVGTVVGMTIGMLRRGR